jgi:hypothetical protein
MTSCAEKRSKQARCRTVAGVNAGDLLASIAGSGEVRPENGYLICELVAEHDGGHAALVATARGGDQWWWLRWGGQLGEAVEVLQIDPCDAELPQGLYADDCLLPAGHPGPHSFDLQPPSSLPGEAHSVRHRPRRP